MMNNENTAHDLERGPIAALGVTALAVLSP